MRRQNIHKSRQRSIRSTDDSRLAVYQTTRTHCVGTREPSATVPFGMGKRGTDPLTMRTDVGRNLYLAVILSCLLSGVNRAIAKKQKNGAHYA